MPLGGWAGTIAEVDRRGLCLVRWSRKTLASIHPIYKQRCAIAGAEFEEYWLGETDLELDSGGPLAIQQPTQITPRPLSAGNQGDRVRMVFGLTADDFLPHADEESLDTYYDHLVRRLSLPMDAKYWSEVDSFQASSRIVKVVALDREMGWDDFDGILCKIRRGETEEIVALANLEIRRSSPNYQLIDDYSEWFCGNLSEDPDDEDLDDDDFDDEEDADEDELGDEPEEEDSDIPEQAAAISLTAGILHLVGFYTSVGAVFGAGACRHDLDQVDGRNRRRCVWARHGNRRSKKRTKTPALGHTIRTNLRRVHLWRRLRGHLRRHAGGIYRRGIGDCCVAIACTVASEHQAAEYSRLAQRCHHCRRLRGRRRGVLSQLPGRGQRALLWGTDWIGLWRTVLCGALDDVPSRVQVNAKTGILESEAGRGKEQSAICCAVQDGLTIRPTRILIPWKSKNRAGQG